MVENHDLFRNCPNYELTNWWIFMMWAHQRNEKTDQEIKYYQHPAKPFLAYSLSIPSHKVSTFMTFKTTDWFSSFELCINRVTQNVLCCFQSTLLLWDSFTWCIAIVLLLLPNSVIYLYILLIKGTLFSQLYLWECYNSIQFILFWFYTFWSFFWLLF